MNCRPLNLLGSLAIPALLALPLPAQQITAEKRDWIEGKSAHFRYFSDGRHATAKLLAEDLEALHATMVSTLPGFHKGKQKEPLPTYVYLFKDASSFEAFSMDPRAQGFYARGQEGDYLAILNESDRGSRKTVYHEYIHHFLNLNFPGLPPWVDEGLAQFFSATNIEDGEVRLGVALGGRFGDLRTVKALHLQDLMTNMKTVHGNESDMDTRQRYATTWAAAHYLIVGNPERRKQLAMYLEMIRRGAPADTAFPLAFKDGVEALDQEIQAHYKGILVKDTISYLRIKVENLKADLSFTSKPLPKDQTMAWLGMLNRRCMDKEARHAARLFNQALTLNNACAPAHLGLGIAAIEAGKYAEAKPSILKAAELDPEDYVSQFLASQLILVGGTVSPEQRTQAREHLLRGLAKAPGNLDALSRLVMMSSFDGNSLDEVTGLILTSLEQYPSRKDLPLQWADALIRHRKAPAAARVLEVLAATGLDGASRKKFEGLRARIQDAAATDRRDAALKRLAAGSNEEGLKGLEEALALASTEKLKVEIQTRLDQERAKLEAKK
jgi:tetratricopeptide (TPR) repeat protein